MALEWSKYNLDAWLWGQGHLSLIHCSLFGFILSSIVRIISSRARGFVFETQFLSNETGMSLTSPLWSSETIRRKMLHPKANLHNPSESWALREVPWVLPTFGIPPELPQSLPAALPLPGCWLTRHRHTGWEVSAWKTLKRSRDERRCGLLLCVHTGRSWGVSWVSRTCRAL